MYKCPICQSDMRLEDVNDDTNIEVDKVIECTVCTVYGHVSKDGVIEYFEGLRSE